LTALNLHPAPLIATTKRLLDQVRIYKQSTALQTIEEDEQFPTQQTTTIYVTHLVYLSLLLENVLGPNRKLPIPL
jgi:hypothetical protein